MKKSLLAVAATTAFAGAAQAQSSVTIYGILDVGYISSSERVSGPAAVTKYQDAQFGTSAETTSRLGFKGTEDLGGGTSAFFTVELGLQPTSASNTLAANNRQSFLGLKKNGIGNFAIGNQYTNIHLAVGQTDPGQQNNMVGSVIYASDPQNATGNVGARPTTFNTGAGTTDAYTIRVANSLSVQSENVAGFQGRAFYSLANTNQTATSEDTTIGKTSEPGTIRTGGTNNYSGWGLGVNYTWQKLFATANYQSFKQETYAGTTVTATGAVTPVSTIYGGAGAGGTSAGTNVTDNQAYIAATYDFGILKAYANWITRKATSTYNSNLYAKRQAQQLGVRSFITPKIEGWASIGNGRVTANGEGQPTANFNAWQLGSNYWLSKRTNLYAIYGQAQTSNVATGAMGTGNTVSYGASNYAVGVRHTF